MPEQFIVVAITAAIAAIAGDIYAFISGRPEMDTVVLPTSIVMPIDSGRPESICLPVEISVTAATLIELGDEACHWPIGEDAGMLFCGADRSGSSHPSYCRHHAARSVAVDGPRVFAAKCPRQLLSA